jgi:hypothetical protein
MVVNLDGTGYVAYPDGSWRNLDANQVSLLVQYLDANPTVTLASVALGNLDNFFGQPTWTPTSPPVRPSGNVVGPNPVPAITPASTPATNVPQNIGNTTGITGGAATGVGVDVTVLKDESARDIIRAILEPYGLAGLTDLAFEELVAGEVVSEARIMAKIRATGEYQARFAGNMQRLAEGKPVLSESEYIRMEMMYAGILHYAALPSGFYDSPDDFDQFIANDVSTAELSARIQNGYIAMQQADPTVRDALASLYGITEGEMVAYMLDPDVALPLIESQVATARMGGAATRAGVGVALSTLERMAALGVSESAAQAGFGQISDESGELYRPLDSTEEEISTDEAAAGAFLGDAAAARRIRQRRANRLAEFSGGGRYATAGGEIVGLRNA